MRVKTTYQVFGRCQLFINLKRPFLRDSSWGIPNQLGIEDSFTLEF